VTSCSFDDVSKVEACDKTGKGTPKPLKKNVPAQGLTLPSEWKEKCFFFPCAIQNEDAETFVRR
jgi:hypothetical protein